MLSWLGDALASSIGKKVVMSLTGLCLVGFLIFHVSGNLTLLADSDGTAFNEYAAKLDSLGVIKWIGRAGLGALFAAHIYLGLRVSIENREARKARYRMRESEGQQTPSSATMFITGAIVLLYLLKHLWDFTLDERFHEDGAGLVKSTLAQPMNVLWYAIGLGALLLHLLHAFKSALQTLGLNHPRWTPITTKLGLGLIGLVMLGFFAILLSLFANR